LNVGLFVGSQRKHGVLEYLNTRAQTHTYSKTGLHPLDRHDEGMKGQKTRWDMGGKASRDGVENACSISW